VAALGGIGVAVAVRRRRLTASLPRAQG
jgi:hypothetical protein